MFKFTNLLVFLSVFCVIAIAAPYQELPPKEGYVPVYIREGNTPLSQVNPKLVEAFREDDAPQQINAEVKDLKNINVDDKNNLDKEKEEETNKQILQLNENIKKDEQVQEAPASDIAEFTSDDIKILADDKINI